jgi:thymidine kinase
MSLELIIGCMFSGKSTEIIKRINRLNTINENYILIKPHIDTRGSHDMIQTHDNIQRKCIVRRSLLPLFETDDYKHCNYIIIEEAQFFQDLEPFILKSVDDDKKKVIVIGLDGDSNRNNFGDIHKLIPLCDNIIKLKALCIYCKNGKEAIFSKRICDDKQQLCIGSNDKYVAVCRDCFLI